MRTIRLMAEMTDEYAEGLKGRLLDSSHFDQLIDFDCDVLKPDGSPLIKLRRRVIPDELCAVAYSALRSAASISVNRGVATGLYPDQMDSSITSKRYRVKRDGSLSNTNVSHKPVRSGIIGYFDRNPRFPFCRQTAFTAQEAKKWRAALPFFAAVSSQFRQHAPDRWQAQSQIAARTNPDFVIPETVFTTVTVNKNWQTAAHRDVGDFKAGFGVMLALRAGTFSGCYLCFPKYRVAVDMRLGDILFADVHELHGNTPLKITGKAERVSLVLYFREKMVNCLSASAEGQRVKRRPRGTPLN